MIRYKPLKQKLMIISTVLILGFAQAYVHPAQAEGNPNQGNINNQTNRSNLPIDPSTRRQDKDKLQQSRWDAAQRAHDQRAENIRKNGGLK
jgi:hypothetical protein